MHFPAGTALVNYTMALVEMHTFAFSDSSQGHLGGGKQPGQVEQGAVVFISLSLDVVA